MLNGVSYLETQTIHRALAQDHRQRCHRTAASVRANVSSCLCPNAGIRGCLASKLFCESGSQSDHLTALTKSLAVRVSKNRQPRP